MRIGSVTAAGVARGAVGGLAGVALAIGLVAALDVVAPVTGLSVVPLLVVVALAMRRGQGAALSAAVRGREVHLTPIEFDLVRALSLYHGKLLTHRQLLTEVWGPN